MSGDRERILADVRGATVDVEPTEAPVWSLESEPDEAAAAARYARKLEITPQATLELFAERCGDYRATVSRCGPEAADISLAVAAVCARQDATRLVAPGDLDPGWLPGNAQVDRDDASLTAGELLRYDGALTGCALAIALTGTLVLDAGATQGRRLLSLVPDLHICVVRCEQIVGSVPEGIALMAAAARDRRPLTLISGPSATSDIELVRVEGVHGPRRLEVVLAGEPAGALR